MNLTMLLDMTMDGFGDRVVVGRQADGLTPAQLREHATVGAQLVTDGACDSIVYLAVNGPAFPVAMFSAALAGVPLVPINYRLGVEQIDRQLSKHPGALLIADGSARDRLVGAGRSVLTPDEWLAAVSNPTAQRHSGTPDSDTDNMPAVIIYTSGTTSEPKGVVLRHDNLVSYVFGTVEFASAAPSDAALVSVPPYHIAAVANVLSNLFAGRRTVILENFAPVTWLETVRTEQISNALIVPTMLSRILDSDGRHDVPTLRSLAYGGAPMPSSVISRALDLWPDVDFVNAYGLTETSSTVAVLSPGDHRAAHDSSDPRVRSRLGSVGRVVPGVELEIRGFEGETLPSGVPGRICVRGSQVSAEYAGIGRVTDADGFFDTRDKGYLDDDGYLFVGGRIDDTIIRGGENIAPAEIEEILFRHSDIVDVAVVGIPDDEWGQRIEAAVVRRSGVVNEDDLKRFVSGILRSSKTPDRFVFWDAIPRTETGKLIRRDVLARLVSDMQSSISD